MNEHKPNIYQLRAMREDLRRIDRMVTKRGNDFVILPDDEVEDTLPDYPLACR
jgi:hypothetical protein